MTKSLFTLLLLISVVSGILAQPTSSISPEDYFYEITDHPDEYAAGTVAARMVDGLGFRFYWATEGLSQEELAFRASEDSRSMFETMDHVYDLTRMILGAVRSEPITRKEGTMPYPQLRRQILDNLETVSQLLVVSRSEEMGGYEAVFQSPGRAVSFPFWNMLNGPIADALYHTGQLVLLRRVAGNPMDPRVMLLQGKVRNNDQVK